MLLACTLSVALVWHECASEIEMQPCLVRARMGCEHASGALPFCCFKESFHFYPFMWQVLDMQDPCLQIGREGLTQFLSRCVNAS